MFSRTGGGQVPVLIDDELYVQLSKYRGFRHLFINSYAFVIRWENLEPLARDSRPVAQHFFSNVDHFVQNT